jgi:hypothetical protein
MLREWCTRDHRSASRAISPAGKVDFHSQDRAFNADDVVACLEHLWRAVSGRMVVSGDGAPMHRRPTLQEFLTNGAAPRLHWERLPASAPELNPDEGLWQPLQGVEGRQVCCCTIPHRRGELRDAIKRVRPKPRSLHGCFRGAKLSSFLHWSVRTDFRGWRTHVGAILRADQVVAMQPFCLPTIAPPCENILHSQIPNTLGRFACKVAAPVLLGSGYVLTRHREWRNVLRLLQRVRPGLSQPKRPPRKFLTPL